MKRFTLIVAVLLLAFLLWQLPRPALSNPISEPTHDLLTLHPAAPQTKKLLLTACYDCHSNQTVWPWYAHINPISDFVSEHVRHGREELNFSNWQEISKEDISVVGKACAKLTKNHSMPLNSYLWLHPEARLSEAQRIELANYFLQLNPNQDEN